MVSRTQRTRIASDGLNGHMFEATADLQEHEVTYHKFKLVPEDVQSENGLTHICDVDLMCSMVKKRQTMGSQRRLEEVLVLLAR